MNRAMFAVNEVVDGNIVQADRRGATSTAVPELDPHRRRRTSSTTSTTCSPASTTCCRARPRRPATTSAACCSIRSSACVGLFDVASELGIEQAATRTSARRSASGASPQGPYLFVPLFGPTTVRDGTGVLVRIYVGPGRLHPDVPLRNSIYGLGSVDLRAQALDASDVARHGGARPLSFIRNAYLQRRRYLVYDGKPPPEMRTNDERMIAAQSRGAVAARGAIAGSLRRSLALPALRAGSAGRAGQARRREDVLHDDPRRSQGSQAGDQAAHPRADRGEARCRISTSRG